MDKSQSKNDVVAHGIDGTTGEYLWSPVDPSEIARLALGQWTARRGVGGWLDPSHLRELEQRSRDEAHFGPMEGVDPTDLAESGWGIVFAADDPAAIDIREALAPLLELRRQQAADRYRECLGESGYRPGEAKLDFLKRHRMGPGPADPDRFPYYLLLVGSPERMPFRFQRQLDVAYAVGRLWFDSLEAYAAYAHSVVDAERGDLLRSHRTTCFGAANTGDRATERSARDLIQPLATTTATEHPTWDIQTHVADGATKAQLLTSLEDSALLISACHGMGFPRGHARQRLDNGALLCQDWPGIVGGRSVPAVADHYLGADDVTDDVAPGGLVAFLFACFGGGTPNLDDFAARDFVDHRRQLAEHPFIARLPQRLLSHPGGGALATVAHVDRTWTWSFSWPGAGPQLAVFRSTVRRLLTGHPVGSAMEFFSQRHAELATELSSLLEDVHWKKEVDPFDIADLWTAHNDARNFMILGDPAVRLAVAPQVPTATDPPQTVGPQPSPGNVNVRSAELEGTPRGSDPSTAEPRDIPWGTLDIALYPTAPSTYRVELQFDRPDSDARLPEVHGTLRLSPGDFLPLELDPEAYGRAVTRALFDDGAILDSYRQVRAVAEAAGLGLRLRLMIAPEATALHRLRWELLRDPDTDRTLATSERILFSRFMVSHDWRPVTLRPRDALRAVVAVAAPTDCAAHGLAPIDARGEVDRARRAMIDPGSEPLGMTVLGVEEPLTVERLFGALRHDVDMLYLVCHGVFSPEGQPFLMLQDDAGRLVRVDGAEVAERMGELQRPPRLVVLASCDSAKVNSTLTGPENEPGAALAPRLAAAGVAAVVAMQAKITMATVERFIPSFFQELLRDGRVDRAMAVARGTVRDRPDAWMPVLSLRLERGRLWSEPSIHVGSPAFEGWDALLRSLRDRTLTPIVGPGLVDALYGNDTQIARRLAALADYPLRTEELDELPRVAQYYQVHQDRATLVDRVKSIASEHVRRHHPTAVADLDAGASLGKLVRRVARRLWSTEPPDEPHHLLAQLPCPLHITATRDDLLERALEHVGKEPNVGVCRFRQPHRHLEELPTPTVQRPLVYHMLGHFKDDDSLVLTEDDHFDYLIQVSRHEHLVPRVVDGNALRSSVLFLGFGLDDWSFRILFRRLRSLGGQDLLTGNSHVMVQLEPRDDEHIDPIRARRFLGRYFTDQQLSKMNLYWGTAADFLRDLTRRLDAVDLHADPEDDDDY